MVTVAAIEMDHLAEVTIAVVDSAAEVAAWGEGMEGFGATRFRIYEEVVVTPPEPQYKMVASSAIGSGIKVTLTLELLDIKSRPSTMEYSKVIPKLGVGPHQVV